MVKPKGTRVSSELPETESQSLNLRALSQLALRCPFPIFNCTDTGEVFWTNRAGKRLLLELEKEPAELFSDDHSEIVENIIRKGSGRSTVQHNGRSFECHYLLFEGRTAVTVYMYEVTDHVQKSSALEEEVIIDEKTGVNNYKFFTRELRSEILVSRNDPRHTFVIIHCDIDQFKRFNDEDSSYKLGDDVLRAVAQVIRSAVRPYDIVARLKLGDEFGAILRGVRGKTDEEVKRSAERIIENIRKQLRALPAYGSDPKPVTLSICALICPGTRLQRGRADNVVKCLEEKTEQLFWTAKQQRDCVIIDSL